MTRTFYRGYKMNLIADEPLFMSLLKYRPSEDRKQLDCCCATNQKLVHSIFPRTLGQHDDGCPAAEANIVSSKSRDGWHSPIIDLDAGHTYLPSSTPTHGHLFLDVEIPPWRWVILMIGLRIDKVIEPGFFWWSLRRGGNFARPPGVHKSDVEVQRSAATPKYGLFRRVKDE